MSLLNFPQGNPLPIRAEMYISGAWVDITSRIRLANEIVISSRGRQNEQGRPGTCTCSFTLNNRDSYFSNRAPNSVNFGKLGKNTPFRVAVTEDRSFAQLDAADTSRVRTVDKASIGTSGDIDVRIEFEPDNWTSGDLGHVLATKWRRTASNNRSWALTLSALGYAQFWVSTDGTNFNTYTSTVPLPVQYGSIALKATIDTDNGASGRTVTFATADAIGGTYTALGSPVISAGVISSFDGTADIELGRLDDGKSAGLTGARALIGRIYAFELRSSINGLVVANADITSRARGTTSWSDGLAAPNTWLVESSAIVTPDNYRFCGEMSSLPQQWDISGRDVFVPAQAADVTRRLGQGGVSVDSAWTHYWKGKVAAGYLSATTPVTGYWPFEDGSTATFAANLVPKGAPATTVNCSFGGASGLPASAGAVTLSSTGSRIYGQTRRTPYASMGSFANFAVKMSSVPSGSTTLVNFSAFGDIGRCNLSATATGYVIAIYDPDGFLVATNSVLYSSLGPTVWNVMRVQFSQAGGTGKIDLGWYSPDDGVAYGATTLTFTGLSGTITGFNILGTSGNNGTQYAQMAIGNYFLDNTTYDYGITATAFRGETTRQRWVRVCAENNVTGQIVGGDGTEVMGIQPITDVMGILYEVADAEQGVLYPDRSSTQLILRTRASLYNQYGPSLSYSAGDLGAQVPLPTDDDQLLRNTVTATSSTGTSATATKTDGPNGTASPLATPPGSGVYLASIGRNVIDDRLDDHAAWDATLGTWDEPRWPQVRVDLERSPYTGTLAKNMRMRVYSSLDVGDLVTLTGLTQAGIPPDDARLFIQGITEVLGNKKWQLQWNTSPYGPWAGNNLTSNTAYSSYRAAATSSTVTTGFNSSATSFQITTTAGLQLWGTTAGKPGNFPLNVKIAGEIITLSGITGTTSPQTANVSARSVNGVIKSHLAGETVQVERPFGVVL